jgi:iron-sulfur cluster repair protein YtfE (RIC family)
MVAIPLTAQMPPCSERLPELQIAMINTMVRCLESEHRKLDEHILQLALAAARLGRDPNEPAAETRTLQAWGEIRRELWSHLQIEDELVFAWGNAHKAVSAELLKNLKVERQEMRTLLARLPELPRGEGYEAEPSEGRHNLARTFTALAQKLDSHIERYDAEVLPAILRAVFHT